MEHITKITSKGQATIPADIRKFLGISTGDAIGFTIEDDKVVIDKAPALDIALLKATESTLTEWASEKDEELFNKW